MKYVHLFSCLTGVCMLFFVKLGTVSSVILGV